MFSQPHTVIENYIKGFRKKYINVVPYLGLTLTLIGLQFFILKKFFPELMTSNFKANQLGGLSPDDLLSSIFEYQSLIAIVSIPIYALISRFVFIDSKKYNVAEHLVITTYISAQIYLVTFLIALITLPFGINFNTTSYFIPLLTFIYMSFLYKKLYNSSWKSSILRSFAYNVLILLFVLIITVIITIIYFSVIKKS